MHNSISQQIEKMSSDLITFRRRLHQNPELAMNEVNTSCLIKEILEQNGINAYFISENIGVTAVIEGDKHGDTIALRADIDALPLCEQTGLEYSSRNENVMHACGHDIHTTVLVGAAIVLNSNRDKLRGNVRLIFQPAEESLGGSRKVLEAGLLDNPKVKCIAALHCWPDLDAGTIGLRKGPMMAASDGVTLKVNGKGGHAAHPHRAVDPITMTSLIITALQTIVSREIAPIDSAVLTLGKISGGTAPNIIPSVVECQGTCRTLSHAVRNSMPERISRIAENVAVGLGGSCEVIYNKQCPPVINDDVLVEKAEESIANAIGNENVCFLASPSMGSEDYAFYLDKVPGVFMRLGTGTDDPNTRRSLHDPKIVFEDETSIPTGVIALVSLSMHLLEK